MIERHVQERLNNVDTISRFYYPELDGLRFFAFLLVFLHHQSLLSHIPFLSFFHSRGWIGVDLFFSLSAFLFTKLLVAEYVKTKTISFKKFYLRRIFRIWPIYFLFIAFAVSLYPSMKGPIGNYIVFRIAGLFTFSDNVIAAVYGYNPLPYIAHIWTITYEEQFYLIIPFALLFLVRSSVKRRVMVLIATLVVLNGIRFVLILHRVPHPAIWVLPVTHFESIVLGIVMGFGGFDWLLKRIKPYAVGLIGLLFAALVGFLPNVDHVSYWLIASYSFVGIATSLVLFSVTTSNRLKRFFSKDVFVFLGKRSYGLYLYHLLGNGVATYITTHATFLPSSLFATFLYSLSFTVLLAIVSYKVIETPFLNLKKRYEVIVSRPI